MAHEVFEQVCEVIQDELERQQNVLAVCKAQRAALSANDIEAVEARTAALESLIRDAVGAEAQRHAVLRSAVDYCELPPERQTMTHLVEELPQPWSSRLSHLQKQLKSTIQETQQVNRANARTIHRSRQMTDRCFAALRGSENDPPGAYDENGAEPLAQRQETPALLDHRG